ncbi:antibiotic biosynthesis monooxygenase family protein [Tahibacter amnicola]|uniref:Antibiotic biosynthesis monooxygenase n=1 Tax=Tahibacter amnicola TaxID=2976241 RepID=A0ABY6BFX9_9GAMM|nr:antibiotic biosynthesis monooxygenase family protein [Tahibacter amnicola]UXI68422.1 antibiotic biosynthesis monooxygenase [Tahibacter amnicola]
MSADGEIHITIWEFQVPEEHREAFEKHYGPNGTWAALFRRGEGHLGTSLLRNTDAPGRYFTIDRWQSESHYAAFRQAYATQYQAIDQICEELTAGEHHIGTFIDIQ